MIVSIALLIIYISLLLFDFISNNFIPILLIVGGYIWLYNYVRNRNFQKKTATLIVEEAERAKETDKEKHRAEEDYKLIRGYLYQLLLDTAEMVQLRIPKSHSELDTPHHYVIKIMLPFMNIL